MPIYVQCAKCSSKFASPDKYAGKSVPCPNCKELIWVPEEEKEISERGERDEMLDAMSTLEMTAIEEGGLSEFEVNVEQQPKEKPKPEPESSEPEKKPNIAMIAGIGGGVLLLIIVVVVVLMSGGGPPVDPNADPWETENRVKIIELDEAAKTSLASSDYSGASGSWDQLLTLVGNRQLKDADLAAVVSGARNSYELMKARRVEDEQGDELEQLNNEGEEHLAKSEFDPAITKFSKIDRILSPLTKKTDDLAALHEHAQEQLKTATDQWKTQLTSELDQIVQQCKEGGRDDRFEVANKQIADYQGRISKVILPADIASAVKTKINETKTSLGGLEDAHKIAMAKGAEERKKAEAARAAAAEANKVWTPLMAQNAFDERFGADIRSVKSTSGAADDAALAGRMLEASSSEKFHPLVLILIYQTAYELGKLDAHGYKHAIVATRRIERLQPQQKLLWQTRAIEVAVAWLGSGLAGAPRPAQLVDQYLTVGVAYLDKDDGENALPQFLGAQKMAIRMSEPPLKLIAQRINEARKLIENQDRINQLIAKLKESPGDQEIILQLVNIYLFEADEPAKARPYVNMLKDADLKTHVMLAAKKLAQLSKEQLLSLTRWYTKLGSDEANPNRKAMYLRAKLYCEEFLAKHHDQDDARKEIKTVRKDVDKNLDNLGVGMKEANREVKKLRVGGEVKQDVEIQQAIAKGVEWLYSQQDLSNNHWDSQETFGSHKYGGYTSLVTYAMRMAGEDPRTNANLRKAIDWVFGLEMKGVYSMCFRAHMWETLPKNSKFRTKIRQDVRRLYLAQSSNGTWHYSPVKSERYDVSTTLAGDLTLWLAETNGIEVKPVPWVRVCKYLSSVQKFDGGWSYTPERDATVAMTAAGLTILLMAKDRGHLDGSTEVREKADLAITRGIRYLNRNFNAHAGGTHRGYTLAAVQHVGLMSGVRIMNQQDWYQAAAKDLVRTQSETGSWGDDVQQTAFCVTFLARGGIRHEDSSGSPGEKEQEGKEKPAE